MHAWHTIRFSALRLILNPNLIGQGIILASGMTNLPAGWNKIMCNSQLHCTAECTTSLLLLNSQRQVPLYHRVPPLLVFRAPAPPIKDKKCAWNSIWAVFLSSVPRSHLCYRCNQIHALVHCPKAKLFIRHKAMFSNNMAQHPQPPLTKQQRSASTEPDGHIIISLNGTLSCHNHITHISCTHSYHVKGDVILKLV